MLMMHFLVLIENMLLFSKITKFVPSYAGIQLMSEITALKK